MTLLTAEVGSARDAIAEVTGRPGSAQTHRTPLAGYIPSLDGWRAIAITAVLVYHGTTSLFYPAGPWPSYKALCVIQTGAKGVDVFFAISGFLICTRLLQERRRTGAISLRAFYLRRAFRILPPFLVYLAVLALMAAAGLLSIAPTEWWASALFLRNYVNPTTTHGWYTGHFWSLAVEEHFYLMWPLFLIAFGSRRARLLVVPLALLIPFWRAIDAGFGGLVPYGHINMRTDTRLDGLLWGCWVALLLEVPAYREWVTRWLTLPVWFVLSVTVVLLMYFRPRWGGHVEALLWPGLLAGTVLHPGWILSRALEFAPVRWVGRLSYSLYIWQQIWLMGSWSESRPFPLGPLQELPLSLVVTFICAIASYYLVERPLLRVGQRLTSEGKAIPASLGGPAPAPAVVGA
jgi:peptidoglycan/LPS O-acetylase OafA/YrhL